MDKQVIEVLRRARAKIEQPEHWGRGSFAQSASGRRVNYDDPKAVKWCAVGAILATVPEGEIRGSAIDELHSCLPAGPRGLAGFNDTKTHADILHLYDCAIARAESDA